MAAPPSPQFAKSFIYPPAPTPSVGEVVFKVSVVVVGFFALIAGVLAILESLGYLSFPIPSLGIVNSSLLTAGGAIFFVLGIAALQSKSDEIRR